MLEAVYAVQPTRVFLIGFDFVEWILERVFFSLQFIGRMVLFEEHW